MKEITIDDSRRVSFREAKAEDEPLLLAIYGSTRLEELALTGWDEAQRAAFIKMQLDAQQTHYRAYYPEGRQLIIALNGEPVGRLYFAELDAEIRIMDLTLLPESRGAGVGAAVIKSLMGRAAVTGRPLSIYVESFNRSLALFERLGFAKSGESGYSHLMKWHPASGAQPAEAPGAESGQKE